MKKYGELIEQIEFFYALASAEKVYGPYRSSDVGRQIVILVDKAGNKRTVSYPKYIMEQHLKRKLGPDETVDHWDSDFNNNDINNLRIMPRKEHSADDTRRVKNIKIKCVMCDKEFERSPRLIRDKSKKGKTSAFCSRECAGKYSREVQLGKRDRMPASDAPKSEYYKRKYVQSAMEYIEQLISFRKK